jgi:CubicO group peptidase (beta-lactamase class C family)
MSPRLLPFLLILPAFSQDFSAIEQSAREELAMANVPGATIAIVRGNQVIFSKAFGVANVETREPMRPDMLFRLGSTTKMLVSSALVRLSLEGTLDLNVPVGKYISGLPPKLSQVTANQLLSHTAGIYDIAPMYGSQDESALGAGIRSWTDSVVFIPPGRIFSYSNPGYWMAGYLLETAYGKPFADAMNELVFQPLGMKATTLRPTMAMTWPLAIGHEEAGRGRCRVVRPAANNAASWPAGSVFSRTADLARFVMAFLNDGMLDGRRVLDPRLIAALSSPHSRFPDSADAYGYGLTIRDYRGLRILEHAGDRSGYGTFVRMAPEARVGIIILTNRTGGTLPATLEKATELLVKLKPAAPETPKPALPLTPADLKRLPGVYQNADERFEVLARGNRLILEHGSEHLELVKHSAVRFGAAGRKADYLIMPAEGDTPAYLFTDSRVFVRAP